MADKLAKAEWAEYRLGDLFEIKSNPQLDKGNFIFDSKTGEYPYFTRTSFNNGILGYVEYLNETHKISGGCLAVGMIAMEFFYMEKDFYAGQFTKRAVPIGFELNARLASYFISLLDRNQKVFQNELVRNFEKIFSETKIQLPTKNGKIDFEFMENFVAELEAQRVAELEAHLTITGQKNYILTEEEESALGNYQNIEWKKFKLGVLFEKLKTKKLTLKAGQLPKQATGVFNLPSLTSSFRNQGLNYFVPRDGATILKNVISLPSNSDVYRAYYQSQEFTVLSDSYAIDWIFNSTKLSPKQYLFAVSSINKVTDLATYSYKNKLGGWNVVSKKSILLPVKDDEIDFAYMETLISAVQKIVIKDVVLYADEKIAATKKIITKSGKIGEA